MCGAVLAICGHAGRPASLEGLFAYVRSLKELDNVMQKCIFSLEKPHAKAGYTSMNIEYVC